VALLDWALQPITLCVFKYLPAELSSASPCSAGFSSFPEVTDFPAIITFRETETERDRQRQRDRERDTEREREVHIQLTLGFLDSPGP